MHHVPTVIDVTDLHRRPGRSRRARLGVPGDATIALPLTALRGDVDVDLLLESLVDGVLARGTLGVPVTQSCARCLTGIDSTVVAHDVMEMFVDAARASDEELEEGYVVREVDGHPVIDVDVLVRDALAAAVSTRPLCRPDCAGLCPTCGTDRNRGHCDCVEEQVDGRWAALADLRLPPGPPDDGADLA